MHATTEGSLDGRRQALTHAIEAQLFAYALRVLARWKRIEVHNSEHLLTLRCPIPTALFNSVHRAQWPDAQSTTRIAAVQQLYQARDLPFLWWVGPSTRPRDLGRRLIAAGFTPAGETIGMAIDLQTTTFHDVAPTCNVQTTSTAARLRSYAQTICDGFAIDSRFRQPMLDSLLAIGNGPPGSMVNFVGALGNGQTVAAASLFLDQGVAGVYNVATIPAFRRRGYGTAVTLAALQEARRRGCRTVILHATTDGAGLYEKLGFERICYFHEYCWPGLE